MRRVLGGMIVGVVLAGVGAAMLYPGVRDMHYQHGVNSGRIEGRLEAIKVLEQRLGTHPRKQDRQTILEAKTSELVMITVDGVETVRAVRP